ncbi:MAG: permease [Campylobacteraceae bacterium]|nr:permease [Campylobacteraceae bacterium]
MFIYWEKFVDYLIYEVFDFDKSEHFSNALNFFIYDTVKIFILLLSIIFIVSLLRTFFNVEKVRAYLQGKSEFTGNILASLFGIITPFCTCSAIPLFLGFLQARIPIGVTFSFLISAPLNNEIAIAMLFSLFGWKITAIYVGFGLFISIVGGYLIGKTNAQQYVLIDVKTMDGDCDNPDLSMNKAQRVKEAWTYTYDIFKKIYLYVLVGVGIGALIHGYVPTDFIVEYTGGNDWYSVPAAVLLGIPMYASAAGVMPLIEVLTQKGMLLGSALAFMMAVTALSLPEALILKRILHTKLILLFFTIIGSGIILIGYVFNMIL